MQTAKAAADERLKTEQATAALKSMEAGLADASQKQIQTESEKKELGLQEIPPLTSFIFHSS